MAAHRSVVALASTVAAAALTLTLPRGAAACKCSDRSLPLLRPAWPEASGLELASESIDIDCDRPDSCAWRWVMVYTRSAAGERARVAMALPFAAVEDLQTSFSGGAVWGVRGDLEDEANAALLRGRDTPNGWRGETGGVKLWVEDEGDARSVELVLEGRAPLSRYASGYGRYARYCCEVNALDVRHPVVPTYSESTHWMWAEVWAPAVRVDARTRVRVRPPAKFEVEGAATLERVAAEEDAVVLEGPSDPGAGLTLVRRRRLKGGPFVGFGGAILDAPNHGRGRLGWEHTFALPFVLYSAAVETDFVRELTAVPAVEISHGRPVILFFLPCAGLGLGAPVQLLPELRAGVRVQASLAWRVFTFLTTFDYLPTPRAGGPDAAPLRRLAFLGQLSF